MDDFLKEMQISFLGEAEEFTIQSESLFIKIENKEASDEDFKSLKRIFHNLKGSGKAVGFDHISTFCHEVENLIVITTTENSNTDSVQLLIACNDELKKEICELQKNVTCIGSFELYIDLLKQHTVKSQSDNSILASHSDVNCFNLPIIKTNDNDTIKNEKKTFTEEAIKVPLKKIDEILDVFGEQIIFLSALDHYSRNTKDNQDLIEKTIFSLKKLSYDLQQQTLSLRMVGLRGLNSKLERVIRDTSKQTGKKINFIFNGLDQELDKTIVDQLSDPLIHMVRNSVDHGVESREERISLGKNEIGNIKITAKREGGTFVIHLQDDGKGLSREKILKKAKEKGLIADNVEMNDSEVFELIFENGFTTKDSASEISGRGVGMNVVKEMILSMKGSYEVESTLNEGTLFKIKLPLSLSLFNGVIIESGNERYIIPSSQINEIIDSRDISIVEIDYNREALQMKEEVIETKSILELLHKKRGIDKKKKESVYIITSFSNKRFALRVDRLISIQKIAQKPLSHEMRICPGASGITILGDGQPVIILDLNLLMQDKGKII